MEESPKQELEGEIRKIYQKMSEFRGPRGQGRAWTRTFTGSCGKILGEDLASCTKR